MSPMTTYLIGWIGDSNEDEDVNAHDAVANVGGDDDGDGDDGGMVDEMKNG